MECCQCQQERQKYLKQICGESRGGDAVGWGVSRLGEQQQRIVEAQEGISSNAAGDGLCRASSGTLFVIKRFEKPGFWAAAATTQGLHPPCSVRDNRQTLTPQWTVLPVEETPQASAGKSKKPDLVSAEEGARLPAADLAHGVLQVRVDLNLQEKQAVGTGQCWGQPPAPGWHQPTALGTPNPSPAPPRTGRAVHHLSLFHMETSLATQVVSLLAVPLSHTHIQLPRLHHQPHSPF